jgi:glycosidase
MAIKNPSVLYEINTRVFLNKLSAKYKIPVTLANIPDEEMQKLAGLGIESVWLMGVWERSPEAARIGLQDTELMNSFREVLPDVEDKDVIGSAYSIREYKVANAIGGEEGLAEIRKKLKSLGIGLILDFVPNHTAPDHPWTFQHSDFYIKGTEEEMQKDPSKYIDCNGSVLANGRDPNIGAWPDVVQLNAFSENYRKEAIATLSMIANICDGVRCDMAMLMLNEVFEQTWEEKAGSKPDQDFWIEIITAIRTQNPDFIFLAEAYWNKEKQLIGQGFNFCYDKNLYDLLLSGKAAEVTSYLEKTKDVQNHLVHFTENHDEQRASYAFKDMQQGAAAAIATLPGLWLFHDGQAEGYKAKIPVHISRGPEEKIDNDLYAFYKKLLAIIRSWELNNGTWQLVKNDNENVFSWKWESPHGKHIVIINYSPQQIHSNLNLENMRAGFIDEMSGTTIAPATGSNLEVQLTPRQIMLLSGV